MSDSKTSETSNPFEEHIKKANSLHELINKDDDEIIKLYLKQISQLKARQQHLEQMLSMALNDAKTLQAKIVYTLKQYLF